MKCLFCWKEISDTASREERESCWHTRCVRKFFGTGRMPEIELTDEMLAQLASDAVNKSLTVPGVQKKLSLHLTLRHGERSRLTIVDYPTGYILKPQSDEYPHLPEFEHLAMHLASVAGIMTVDFALVQNGADSAYITRRSDRIFRRDGSFEMLAMEDFCQLSGRQTADKYRGSLERCGKIVREFSSRPGIDITELFMRIVFSFIIGNSDMHLKNFSLIEDAPRSRRYILSPAYDMMPVNIVLPEDTDESALTLNGKRSNLKRIDFLHLADSYGISESVATRIIDKMCSLEDRFISECRSSHLTEEYRAQIQAMITGRIARLQEWRG